MNKDAHCTISQLTDYARYLRALSVYQTTQAGSGHLTSCLSLADIASVLYFTIMQQDTLRYDRCILSKGHASALLYAVYYLQGRLSFDQLSTYRQHNSVLEGHPTPRLADVDVATGSLGMGLSVAIGQALAYKQEDENGYIYVLLGDMECTEGSFWEALYSAAYHHLDNLVAIVDYNGLGQCNINPFGSTPQRLADIATAIGWNVQIINGHSMNEIIDALSQLKHHQHTPHLILASTIKGKGVSFIENALEWHGKPLSTQQAKTAYQELGITPEAIIPIHQWHRTTPYTQKPPHTLPNGTTDMHHLAHALSNQTIATRTAYGQALSALAPHYHKIIIIDAEVKNSTGIQTCAEQFPEKFLEVFIAEQNMIAIAMGYASLGYSAVVTTFAAFLTRAHDQLRMAAISRLPLRVVGSHAGVSIGQDGPSQMGLEDIGLFRSLPNAIILYPCDAISTYHLTNLMLEYTQGISYLRTTRGATPIIYSATDTFTIGGCAVVRKSPQDCCCIIAAGITLHEALKAYDLLCAQQHPRSIAIIDLYSVYPFDKETIIQTARDCNNTLMVVEDHYATTGIGTMLAAALCNQSIAVHIMGVTHIPASATPQEQLHAAHIDAQAIVKKVMQL